MRGISRRTGTRAVLAAIGMLIPAGLGLHAQAPRDGSEGVSVHGHWTLTVRNADHSVAARHEFANALQDGAILLRLLAGQATLAETAIAFDVAAVIPTEPVATSYLQCVAADGTGPVLTVVGNAVQMTCSLRASRLAALPGARGQIVTATTYLRCLSVEPDAVCRTLTPFTVRDLTAPEPSSVTPPLPPPPPIYVKDGQIIDVTVVISFGPAH